jgi:hypothetical protein
MKDKNNYEFLAVHNVVCDEKELSSENKPKSFAVNFILRNRERIERGW